MGNEQQANAMRKRFNALINCSNGQEKFLNG